MTPVTPSLDALLDGEARALTTRATRVRALRAVAAAGLTAGVAVPLLAMTASRAPAVLAWVGVVLAAMIGWMWHRGVTISDAMIAAGIERDQQLRVGQLRVSREAASSGPLGAHAAATLVARLSGAPTPRAATLTADVARRSRQAALFAGGGVLALILAGMSAPDGMRRLARPWGGPALAPVTASGAASTVRSALIADVVARATYPAYLGRPPEAVALGGTLVVPRGTVLDITARVADGRSASLVPERGTPIAFASSGALQRASLTASASGAWRWELPGADGELPPTFALDVRADSAPVVELASTSDTLLLAGAEVPLDVMAQDDHALVSVSLVVLGPSGVVARRELLEAPAPGLDARTTLALSSLGDADVLRVQVTAVDNSPWKQVGRSRVLVLRRAGLDARRQQARATADSVAAGASALARQQQQLAQQTSDAARTAGQRERGDSALSFEGREEAEKLANQQRALQQQAQRLQQQARQLEDQLKSAGALDSALQGRLAEAQQLLQQALSPQLMQRLQQLEQSAQRQDAQATRQSLDDLARQQQALREQLERNAEMLRRAALEGSMETLRDEAQELADAAKRLADSAATKDFSLNERRRAEDLARRSEQLQQGARDLQQRLTQAQAEPGAQRTAEAQRRAEQAARELRDAARANQSPESAARQGAQNLQQAADELARAREDQVQQWKDGTSGALDQAMQDMMQMAQQQRQLAQQAQQAQSRGEASQSGAQQRAREQASLQNGIQQAQQQVQEASRSSQHVSQGSQRAMQEAMQKAREATQQAQRAGNSPEGQARSGQQAADAMREAANAMDRAASSLVRDRERTNRAQSASGLPEMMEEMQQLARQQQQVNSQAGQMSMMPGGEQGAQGQTLSQQLSRRQRQIAQQLEDVGGADRSGRADALAQEARRLADAMERAMSDPETTARREQFYQRLLSAGRTLRREDIDQQQPRESKPGIGMPVYAPRTGAANGAPASRVAPPSWDELRALTPEERRAVLQYFEKVGTSGVQKP
jgi:hypothetical protein